MQSRLLFFAAIAGFIGVVMGAFGAHGLKSILSEPHLEIYKTAVSYQMWHALLLGLVATLPANNLTRWAAWCLLAGIILFSGSLYVLAIFNLGWLGMITPLGGLAFLAGWAILASHAYLQSTCEPKRQNPL